MCLNCEDTSTVQTLLCPIWKRAWKISLEIWCTGTVKSQPGWSNSSLYEALIFQYIKPTESCGNVPGSIRIIEGKVWGRERKRAVPLKGWYYHLWLQYVVTSCGLWSRQQKKMAVNAIYLPSARRPRQHGWNSQCVTVPNSQKSLENELILSLLGRPVANMHVLC